MDPQQQFCHNEGCRAYGRKGEGHIVIHSQKERRYRCKRCGRTFTQTKGSALYRIHKPKWLVVAVVTLLAYGFAHYGPSLPPSISMSAPWPAGKGRPLCSARGCTNTR
jgi:transposase-like protein